MVKNRQIQKLIEIAKKNRFSRTKMASLLGVSYGTWNRYIKGETEPTYSNNIEKAEQIIEKYS